MPTGSGCRRFTNSASAILLAIAAAFCVSTANAASKACFWKGVPYRSGVSVARCEQYDRAGRYCMRPACYRCGANGDWLVVPGSSCRTGATRPNRSR